jgi:hypothetical protein
MDLKGRHDVVNRMTAYLYVENNQDSRNSLVMDVTSCCHPSLSGPRKTSGSVSHHIRTCNVTAGHTGITQLQLCQKIQWQRQRRIWYDTIIAMPQNMPAHYYYYYYYYYYYPKECQSTLSAWSLKMGSTGCTKTMVAKYQHTRCNNPQHRTPQLHHALSLRFRNSSAISTIAGIA